jgi:uncharacterized RDD family membrane protein YckC
MLSESSNPPGPEPDLLGARSLRALAKTVDLTLIVLICWGLVAGEVVSSFFAVVGAFLALAILWDAAVPGRSVGKALFRLQVVSDDTLQPCSRLQAIGRNASFLFLPVLDWVFILFKDRRRVGDNLFSTVVLKDWQVSLLPPASQPDLIPDPSRQFFETVARFHDPIEAEIVRGRLEAEGIPAIAADANLIRVHSLMSAAVGGVKVQVPPEHLERAHAICRSIAEGKLELDDGE